MRCLVMLWIRAIGNWYHMARPQICYWHLRAKIIRIFRLCAWLESGEALLRRAYYFSTKNSVDQFLLSYIFPAPYFRCATFKDNEFISDDAVFPKFLHLSITTETWLWILVIPFYNHNFFTTLAIFFKTHVIVSHVLHFYLWNLVR